MFTLLQTLESCNVILKVGFLISITCTSITRELYLGMKKKSLTQKKYMIMPFPEQFCVFSQQTHKPSSIIIIIIHVLTKYCTKDEMLPKLPHLKTKVTFGHWALD